MRALLILAAVFAAPSLSQASCGGESLSAPVQSITHVVKDAVEKQVYGDGALAEFLQQSKWTNPFANLTGLQANGYRRAFELIDAFLDDNTRAQVKANLREYLKQRGGEKDVAAQASEDTGAVIAPSLYLHFPIVGPQSSELGTLTMAKIEGRPVFIEALPERPSSDKNVFFYDPFNSDETLRFHKFKQMTDLPERQSEEIAPAPKITFQQSHLSRIRFFSGGKAMGPSYALGSGRRIQAHWVTTFYHLGKAYALLPYHAASDTQDRGVQVLDIAAGAPVREYPMHKEELGISFRNGEPVIYFTTLEAMNSNQHIGFVEVWTGVKNYVLTRRQRELRPVPFVYKNIHYLVWSETGIGFSIVDVDSGTVAELPIPDLKQTGKIIPFEYRGDLYLFVVENLARIIKVTAKTRP